ncbi:UDP-glucuronosyltransferase 2C1-like [Sipha flava]|uniref:UDP-glucuronosyltransferase 2C1-like n=2 Tax=Sipha flava TaxID=143950 RepID=A0A8B8G974_9HEMI|nr:UDP-glucuronosyltransferase 2C1-like [Sipha flava]
MRCDRNALTAGGGRAVVAAALLSSVVLFARAERVPIRVLAVQTIGARGHWDFMSSVLRALVDRGHVVTAYTPHPDGGRANYTEVDVSKGLWQTADATVTAARRQRGAAASVAASRHQCDLVYGHYRMRELLRRARPPNRFDLVIAEPLMSDCAGHAAAELRLPLIYVTASPVIAYAERAYTGHTPGPASVSHAAASHAVPNTFSRRLANAVQWAATVVSVTCAEVAFRHTEPRAYDSLGPVAPSLVFVNGHLVVDPARPVATNVVNVGGIHFKTTKRLPKDILEFIEQSPDGVIYFTLGSTVKISTAPERIKKSIMEALSQLPQRVLMKYEDKLRCKPKNVMTKIRLPQRDILLHPKVKLFVSDGGVDGLYEAIDAGVPVLGFPLLLGQTRNIESLVSAGMAISMDLISMSNDTLLKSILNLLNDQNYTNNARLASKIFKDRPMSPTQSVVYWTEYVLRHKGAPHLKSSAPNLMWYQYYLLDIISVVLTLGFVILFVAYKGLKSFYNYYYNYSRDLKSKSQ